jgi:hypothetical protein
MGRGGKREGAGRKSIGNTPKTVIKRMSVEDLNKLENYDRLIHELEEKIRYTAKVEDFKVFKLKGESVIKLDDLIAAGVIQINTYL